MRMKEKVRKHCWFVVSCFATVVLVVAVAWLLVLFYRQTAPYAKVLEAGAVVDQSDGVEEYDAAVTLRDVERGSLPKGMTYTWGYYISFSDGSEPKELEKPELRLENPLTFYEFAITVRNDTDEAFSGLKFRFDTGIEDSDRVVADNMAFVPELVYGDKVMRMPLDIYGNGAPFCFELMGGFPVILYDGNGEATYPWESVNQDMQEKGFDLDVPPGETWTLSLNFVIMRVKGVKVKTLMSARGVSGSEIELRSPKGGDIIHIESEIEPLTLVECQTLCPMLTGKAELVPGSVQVNGKRAPDFEIESADAVTGVTHFKGVDLGEYADGNLRLEYDMKLKPGEKPEAVTFITCIRDEKGSNLASTAVLAIHYTFSLQDLLIAGGCFVVAFAGVVILVALVALAVLVKLSKRKEK